MAVLKEPGLYSENVVHDIMMANNLPHNGQDVRYYDRFARFGVLDPYNKLTYGREYLFFVKPDLHIYEPNTTTLQSVLATDPFFIDLAARHPNVIGQLQKSAGSSSVTSTQVKSPFMNLLSNSVSNTLDLQGLTAGTMDGPANMWGGSNTYRKDAWLGDEGIEFSLEFEDTKTLDIYYLLKAYENYHRYMMAGYIYPPNIGSAKADNYGQYFDEYTANKRLHTTIGIYRFIVDEDHMNLIYWAYICGAYFVNVPRDGLNGVNGMVSDGLKYTVDFKAFCVDDLNPVILSNFNTLVRSSYSANYLESAILNFIDANGTKYNDRPKDVNVYTSMNGEWPLFPLIQQVNSDDVKGLPRGMKHAYRMLWFSDQVN